MYYIHKRDVQGWASSAQGLQGSMGMTYCYSPKPLLNQGTYLVFILKFHCLALKGFYVFTTAQSSQHKSPQKEQTHTHEPSWILLCKDWLITKESKAFQSQGGARHLRHRRVKRKLMGERLEKSKGKPRAGTWDVIKDKLK